MDEIGVMKGLHSRFEEYLTEAGERDGVTRFSATVGRFSTRISAGQGVHAIYCN